MAIDTREKRFSMLNFGDGSHIHTTFEADGAVDLDDRQHLLDCYSGIAFAAPPSVTIIPALDIYSIAGNSITFNAPRILSIATINYPILGQNIQATVPLTSFPLVGIYLITGQDIVFISQVQAAGLQTLWINYLDNRGFTVGSLNDRLKNAFNTEASIATEVSLADAMMIYFDQQAIPTGSIRDRFLSFLDTNFPLLTGSVTDKLRQTLINGEFFI